MEKVNKAAFYSLVLATTALCVLSPFIYFRHDDWIILGNSVNILPNQWSFLWSTDLYFSPGHKTVWFFRPFFKLIVWGAHQYFGFNHFLWLFFQWLLLVGATFIGRNAINNFYQNSLRGDKFIVFFISSFSIYFSSLIWIGEGMMNIPQLFLLSSSVYFLSTNTRTGSLISILAYSIALGFKESSVFLPLFLVGQLKVALGSFKQRTLISIYLIIMIVYLIYRLLVLPINPGYKPYLSFETLFIPTIYFLIFLGLPFLVIWLNSYKAGFETFKTAFPKLLFFTPFLISLVLPHLGHPFFSTGWLLVPGFFTIWALVVSLDDMIIQGLSAVKIGALAFILSLIPVSWQAYQLDWLRWGRSQKGVHEFLKNIKPEEVGEVYIETCVDPNHPEATFERVVGATENLQHLWGLHHSTQISFTLTPCGGGAEYHKPAKGRVFAKWHFPTFKAE